MRQKKIAASLMLMGFCVFVMLTPTRGFMLQNSVIPVGKLPDDIAVNPLTNTIYVANGNSDSVSVIDGKTNTVTTTINVGGSPASIAINPTTNLVYVANNYDKTISAIDGATNTVIKTIDNVPDVLEMAVNPTTKLLYVLGIDDLKVIDSETNTTFITTINGEKFDQLALTPILLSLAVDATRNVIYISYTTYGGPYAYISVINGKTNTLIGYIEGPIELGPKIALDSVTNKLYAVGDDGVSVIDATTRSYITTIKLDIDLTDIAVNSATNLIYVDSFDRNTIAKIDGRTNRVIAMMSGVEQSTALIVNPMTNRLYVSNYELNTVSMIGEDALSTVTPTYTPGGPTITPSATLADTGGGGGP